MKRTCLILLLLIAISICSYLFVITPSNSAASKVDYDFNLENVSANAGSKKMLWTLPASARAVSLALDSGGLQSYSLWVKVQADDLVGVDEVIKSLIARKNALHRLNLTYKKVDFSDGRVRRRDLDAPSWWNPGIVRRGYALINTSRTSLSIIVDEERLIVFVFEGD